MAQHPYSNVTAAVVAGAAIGAGIALLYAPKSGQDTRRQIQDYATKTRSRVHEAGDRVRARGRELADRGRALADRGRAAARDVAEHGRRMANRAADEVEAVASEPVTRS